MGDKPSVYETGTRFGQHEITRRERLEHLDGYYYELIHHGTGARHIHVATADDNNSFAVTFPTVPNDSTGVAHILEHVVLAGSEKFPVRDPFFSMIPRSLKTFMNAMTAYDATTYPFSTRNKKDFFNLLDVYLDATFFPRLDETSFKQEGHRFEFENTDDVESGLRYKGVVFNEMKGALASPHYIVGRAIGKALFPDLTYANYSGGDPEVMPELRWEQLRAFHGTHYHPSNAYFFTYGNLPLDEILQEIEKHTLSRFQKINVDVSIPDQHRFTKPKEFQIEYPLGKEEDPAKKSQVLVAWVAELVSDSLTTLAFKVLQEVLLGNASSPLHKALIDSRLGDSLANGTGYQTNYREAVFAAGLKGASAEDADKIEAVILETLEKLVKEGIEHARVDAAIHQLEIRSREVSNAGFPYSLRVLFQLWPAYIYGGDPYRSLQFDADIAEIQKQREAGPFFEDFIRRWFLDNPHRARIVVRPDQDLEEKWREAELDKLGAIEAGLTDAQKHAIAEETRKLKELQEAKQDLTSLPSLELSDIPMEFEDVAHRIETIGGSRVGLFPQPTNGLSYIDVRVDFSSLPERLLPLLGVFSYALTRSGAAEFDYLEMAARIDAYTGGISASVGVRSAIDESIRPGLTISGKALARNNEEFVAILRDIVRDVRFDPKRLEELIAEEKIEHEGFVIAAGNFFAQMLAAGKISPASAVNEKLHGLSLITTLRELSEMEDLAPVIEQLDEIREILFRQPALSICITAEEKSLESLRAQVEDLVGGIESKAFDGESNEPSLLAGRHEARTTSAPVAYNARAFKTVAFEHPDAPALFALGHFMRATYLHREIREKGGAYGSASQSDREGGLFIFSSYRDPNIARTYKVFGDAVTEILRGELDPQDVKEAIISACGAVDPLLSPDTKGRNRFFDDLSGYTLEQKQAFKKELLSLADEDLIRVAEKYLTGEGSMATIGNPAKVEEANKEMGEIFEVSPV